MAENKQDTVRGRPWKRLELRSVTGVEHPDHIHAVGARLWQQLEAWEGPGDPLEVTAIAQARYEVGWGGRGRAGCQGEQPYRTLMTGRGNEGEGAWDGFWPPGLTGD